MALLGKYYMRCLQACGSWVRIASPARLQFAWSLLAGRGTKFFGRAWNRLCMIAGKRTIHRIDGLANMVEASHALTRYLKENGKSFADCVRRLDR